jgi:XTP/dITP diphosphohydrolase
MTATPLLLATRNAHKVDEIRALLGQGYRYCTLNDMTGAPTIVEDAETFAGNAMKKAMGLARWLVQAPDAAGAAADTEMLILADDSGLEVDALQGAPGVHSARFAALEATSAPGAATGVTGNSSDAANNTKLLRLLANVPPEARQARFRCVLALVELHRPSDPADGSWRIAEPRLFEGVCEGRIASAPSGRGGFGYDPLFVPYGFERSFAELGPNMKNKFSHRAKALSRLRDHLR